MIIAGLVAPLLSGLLVSGCVTISTGKQATDTVTLALEVPAGTPARVETFNGDIEVTAAPGSGSRPRWCARAGVPTRPRQRRTAMPSR